MNQSFTVVKKGYDQKEVTKYILQLESELNRYKEKEEHISKALVEAQSSSTRIIQDAELQAKNIEINALAQLEHLRNQIQSTKEKLENFQIRYNQFIQRFTLSFNDDDLNSLFSALDTIAATLEVDDESEHEGIVNDTNI